MTAIEEEVREGSSLESPVPESNPKSAQRARSVALPSLNRFKPVTQRVRSAGTKTASWGASAAKAASAGDSLLHSQPPTFVQCWEHHMEAVRRHEGWWWTIPRWAWAVIHTFVIKPPLNLFEWITARPLWSLLATAIYLALKFRSYLP